MGAPAPSRWPQSTDEARALDVPVRLLALSLQIDAICQALIQELRDLAARRQCWPPLISPRRVASNIVDCTLQPADVGGDCLVGLAHRQREMPVVRFERGPAYAFVHHEVTAATLHDLLEPLHHILNLYEIRESLTTVEGDADCGQARPNLGRRSLGVVRSAAADVVSHHVLPLCDTLTWRGMAGYASVALRSLRADSGRPAWCGTVNPNARATRHRLFASQSPRS